MQAYGYSRARGRHLRSSTAFERLVVQVGDRAGGDAGAPEDLAYVPDAPCGDVGQVHFDDGLLHAGLAPFVAIDDGGGEPHPLELGHLERDLARCGGEASLVVSRSVRRALVGALVRARADELVGILVEHGVDGLLDGFPDRLAKLGLHCLLVG